AVRLQGRLALSQGPTLRIVWFQRAEDGRLLLIAHHLMTDGVSWRVLLEDLQHAHDALQTGAAVAFDARTTSYGAWADALVQQVGAEWVQAELPYWRDVLARGAGWRLPLATNGDEAAAGTIERVFAQLDREETRWLLEVLPARHDAQIHRALLAAAARCLSTWTGRDGVLFHLDSHGRHEFPDAPDVSRTVGWF